MHIIFFLKEVAKIASAGFLEAIVAKIASAGFLEAFLEALFGAFLLIGMCAEQICFLATGSAV